MTWPYVGAVHGTEAPNDVPCFSGTKGGACRPKGGPTRVQPHSRVEGAELALEEDKVLVRQLRAVLQRREVGPRLARQVLLHSGPTRKGVAQVAQACGVGPCALLALAYRAMPRPPMSHVQWEQWSALFRVRSCPVSEEEGAAVCRPV